MGAGAFNKQQECVDLFVGKILACLPDNSRKSVEIKKIPVLDCSKDQNVLGRLSIISDWRIADGVVKRGSFEPHFRKKRSVDEKVISAVNACIGRMRY